GVLGAADGDQGADHARRSHSHCAARDGFGLMAQYRYLAVDEAGQERGGQLQAASEEAARRQLLDRRYHIVELEAARTSGGAGNGLSAERRISDADNPSLLGGLSALWAQQRS